MMAINKKLRTASPAAAAHLDELLDEALQETFPASDPVAINIEREKTADDASLNSHLPAIAR
jgi:hypothetical protein